VLLVFAVGQSSCSGLVDNPAHIQAGDLTSLLGSLTLRIVEVSRHGNHRIGYFLTQIILSRLLHFLKNHSRDFLGRILAVTDDHPGRIVVPFHHRKGNPADFL